MKDYTLYGVIMAGGRGRRLWPLSTSRRPKQFVKFDGESLISRTFRRIRPLIDPEKLLVITNKDKGSLVSEEIPQLPGRNIIEEPIGKNTAPCIGLAAVYSRTVLGLEADNSVMVVLPSDHMVEREEKFRSLLGGGAEAARKYESLVTLGIEPTRPATGYGYIAAGDRIEEGRDVRKVLSFTEKPDLETAEEFLEAGNYYWNSGTFVWGTDVLLSKIKEYMPNLHEGLKNIEPTLGTRKEKEVLSSEYKNLPGISIDYGLMEKAENRAVIPASVGWSDLGDWPSLQVLLANDGDGNSFSGKVKFRESEDNLVYNQGEKPIVSLGVSGTVIVNTPEAVLVMDKEKAQLIKEIAKDFESTEWEVR